MTAFGVIFVGAYALALFGGRRWFLCVLAVSLAFNDSVVFAAGSATITAFYLGLIIYAVGSATLWKRRPVVAGKIPGRALLVLLVVYSLFVTLVSPALFEGIGVVSAGSGLDEQAQSLTPLAYTSSNIAQMSYLLLNVFFVWRNQRDGAFNSRHITVALAIGAFVAASSFLGGPWPHAFFDNSPRGFYTDETARLRGQFSEPSHLGAFAVTATVYFGVALARVRSVRAFVAQLVLVSVALSLLVASASGTAAIGLCAAVVVMAFVLGQGRRLSATQRVPVPLFLGVLFGGVVFAILLPRIIGAANSIVSSKIGSTSLSTRTLVDRNSVEVFLKTFTLGAGNGSNRGSSLFLMLLSQIGLIGTIVFCAVSVLAVVRGLSMSRNVAAALALIGFLSAAFVSLADFASPILWALIAVTLSSSSSTPVQQLRPDSRSVQARLGDEAYHTQSGSPLPRSSGSQQS